MFLTEFRPVLSIGRVHVCGYAVYSSTVMTTFVDTLKRDVGVANTVELSACMMNRDHWASRRAAQLRLPQ